MKNFDLIIVGLGNPGEKYEGTRHNAGFLALAEIARELAPIESFTKNEKLQTEYLDVTAAGKRLRLIRPLGFMNKSGEVLQKFLKYEGLEAADLLEKLLVIADDADQLEGGLKLTARGRSGGHRGLENIFAMLGSNEIKRIKLGIRPSGNQEQSQTFVMAGFDSEGPLGQAIKKIPKIVDFLLKKGLAASQSKYNSKE